MPFSLVKAFRVYHYPLLLPISDQKVVWSKVWYSYIPNIESSVSEDYPLLVDKFVAVEAPGARLVPVECHGIA